MVRLLPCAASMGPSMSIDGVQHRRSEGRGGAREASMGPSMSIDGVPFTVGHVRIDLHVLQWGRR